MINWTVISVKDVIKKILKIFTITIIIYLLFKIYDNYKIKEVSMQTIDISKYNLQQYIKLEIPRYKKEENKKDSVEYAKIPVTSELPILDEKYNEEIENEIFSDNEDIVEEDKLLSTQGALQNNNISIKNQTSYEINDEVLSGELTVNMNNILIFHTHTCESYTPTSEFSYEGTGNFRTTDLNYTVAKVGDELETNLLNYGFKVIHDKTYHDYPAYTGSYGRSLNTIQSILKNNNNYDIIIDIHRDAVGSDPAFSPSIMIGDDNVAQLMFVIGTDEGGLEHSNWKENLKFAIAVQKKAEEMYPNLFRPIIVRKSRYNQHLSKAACIIEVGATGNTLEQATTSMKYLAKVLNQLK